MSENFSGQCSDFLSLSFYAARYGVAVERLKWGVAKERNGKVYWENPVAIISDSNKAIFIYQDRCLELNGEATPAELIENKLAYEGGEVVIDVESLKNLYENKFFVE